MQQFGINDSYFISRMDQYYLDVWTNIYSELQSMNNSKIKFELDNIAQVTGISLPEFVISKTWLLELQIISYLP